MPSRRWLLAAACGLVTGMSGCTASEDDTGTSTPPTSTSPTDSETPTVTPCSDYTPTEYYPDLRAYNSADREVTVTIEVDQAGEVVLRRDVTVPPRSEVTIAEDLYETGTTYTIRAIDDGTVLAEASHEARGPSAPHDFGPLVDVGYDGELTAEIEVHMGERSTPPPCSR